MNRRKFQSVLFLASLITAILTAIPGVCFARVRLPAVISDNMVLQQGMKVPVWGWAKPGESIRVKCSWQDKLFTTNADKKGQWKLKLDAPKPGGPYEMTVRGRNMIKIQNILCGEVWICSGQSNMEMPVGNLGDWKQGVLNYQQVKTSADDSMLRLFKVEKEIADEPQKDCQGQWLPCTSDVVNSFSAVAYFFGRELRKELEVPVGLIQSCWGGTVAEAWISKDVLMIDTDFAQILERFEKAKAEYKAKQEVYNKKLKEWMMAAIEKKEIANQPEMKRPDPPRHKNSPSSLYNGMISPLIPYGIAGAIWYQGEANVERAYQYRKLFTALILNWRLDWEQGDFPFYYVQIAPYKYDTEYAAAELREAQLMTMSLPNTGMVVTTDIANVDDIHPRNKQDVGKRLALWALTKTYQKNEQECSGPIFDSMRTEGSKIRLFFDYVDGGLVAKGGELTGFEIAGDDRQYHKANAEFQGRTILVSSKEVKKPVAVRFGWSNTAQPNLFNKEGLPASPFRTDDWDRVTRNNK